MIFSTYAYNNDRPENLIRRNFIHIKREITPLVVWAFAKFKIPFLYHCNNGNGLNDVNEIIDSYYFKIIQKYLANSYHCLFDIV